MKLKIEKILKIGGVCFSALGIVFGTIYSITNSKDYIRSLAVGNNPIIPQNGIYYNSMDEISISTGSSIKLYHQFNINNYVYANPSYWDTLDAITSVNQTTYDIDLINPFSGVGYVFNEVEYTTLRFSRDSNVLLRFGLYEPIQGTYVSLFRYLYTNSLYINIDNLPLYQDFFSGNFTVYVQDNLVQGEINLYKYLAYYYSQYSPNLLTLNMTLDLKSAIIPLYMDGNKPLLLNNSVFYSTYLSNEIGYTDLITFYEIGVGGYYTNNQYYSVLRIGVGSVYDENATGNEFTRYLSDSNESEVIVSNNESYKGYYYIHSVQLCKVFKITGGLRYDPVEIYGCSTQISIGSLVDYVMSYSYRNLNYQNIKVLYSKSGFLDLSYSLSFTKYLSSLGDIIPYASNFDEPTISTTPFAFTQVFEWLNLALIGIAPFLNFGIGQGITIGVILITPLVISIILFIVKLFKR